MNRIKLNSLQQKVIPVIRDGLNTIIQTSSGTGKTLCYSVPIIEQKRSIVLTPTKELSIQTYKIIRELDPNIKVSRIGSIGLIAPIVEMISDQEAKKLQNYAKERIQRMNDSLRNQLNWDLIDICISTPGQLAQLVKLGCKIQDVNCLVIDEADLTWGDVSFRESIYTIQRYLNINQFVLCNSVNTIKEEKELKSLDGSKFTFYISKDYMQMPKRNIEFMNKPLEEYLENQKTIIFVDGEKECQDIQKIVGSSKCFHSRQSVEERIRNLEEFRTKEQKTLICTGLGSRGLDFPEVTQIILYDLPRNYEAFLLQCGRLRQENGRIIVRLKDSFESAIYNEYERYKYVFPNSCVKL
ncbi:unnamed protein product [Paramecium primaurelia]|uniref:ATP-dependent RNA helicase n=1 Tax=Paramecium primaurelia TaxID=5886 RepID=A0A8S1NL24_PARPR|nr:unnamed protein product [Paramecium primaurelia]